MRQWLEVPGGSLETKKLLIVCGTAVLCSAFIGAGLARAIEFWSAMGSAVLFVLAVAVASTFSPFKE